MKKSTIRETSHSQGSQSDEIDLIDIVLALWRGKWVITVTTIVFAVCAILYSINLPNIYKADALLAPSETSNPSGLAGMAGQLGGLAALTGVNFGTSEYSRTDLAVQVIKSRQFIGRFIEKHDLLVPLLAAKGWDLNQNELLLDSELYDEKNNKWLRDASGLRSATPSSQEAYEFFRTKVFSINKDKESGLYVVSVKHYSPYIAKKWLNWLIEDINDVMRKRTIDEASQNLDYLNTQLRKTAITDMQSTFYKLIEEQTKSLMLAEVQEEFVFKTVDPATVPEIKSEPNRAFICVLITLIGAIFSSAIVLLNFALREKDK
ncbi:Wzz/FepE/Etk N-terminal domain-containing protein [Vibrio parahaemolyticus]|uniref:Regulator of length of O-antigen component of lipopolysaccharide chains n=1 Tax=Vibrio parahaemolyticus TaxID=670 RepID=A0A5P5X5N4_VIBPH|nr:Wzz/FepE/Etk N-terminal domain-containing protein [Vibrio parahaemolyticus]QFF90529.1 regulator of length of O-antigen component of lipopolysaccharide chains [Vibrio parahaemolyticus]